MWSEKFSAVREIFFFQKGDLHNSFGRSDVLGGLALLQRVDSSKPAHATTPQHDTPHHTVHRVFIVTKQRMFKLSLNSSSNAGGLKQLSWRAI